MGYFSDVFAAADSIMHGMAVTFANFWKPTITVQYPDRPPIDERLGTLTWDPPERFRGMLEVDTDICTACLACSRGCPIDCIQIDVVKLPDKRRVMTRFDIDEAKCMYCGLCTEHCPTGSIHFTPRFESSTRYLGDLYHSFVDTPRPIYKNPKAPKPPKPAEPGKPSAQAESEKPTQAEPEPPAASEGGEGA